MRCQNCNKNQATVRYTQIINGKKTEMHLCEKCSNELGINNYSFNMPIDFSSFLSDFMDDYNIPTLVKPQKLKCEKCNMTYDEFLNIGKFGCSNCYNTFSSKIDSILKKINGANRYLGEKSLKENNNIEFKKESKIENDEIIKLREQLKVAIKKEEYEEAAKIRDKIKDLERGMKNE